MDNRLKVCVVIVVFSVQTMRKKPMKQVLRRYPSVSQDIDREIVNKLKNNSGSKPYSVLGLALRVLFPH
jgi:hypothetical protein